MKSLKEMLEKDKSLRDAGYEMLGKEEVKEFMVYRLDQMEKDAEWEICKELFKEVYGGEKKCQEKI